MQDQEEKLQMTEETDSGLRKRRDVGRYAVTRPSEKVRLCFDFAQIQLSLQQ